MIKLKTDEEIKIINEGGHLLSKIIHEVGEKAKEGVSTKELDWLAENSILKCGGTPAFKNYQPDFSNKPFPTALCVSVNNTIVHGIPSDYLLQNGDLVKLDLGMKYKGLYTDMAITVGVGKISSVAQKLISTTRQALSIAIKTAQVGRTLGDVGYSIEHFVRSKNFYVVKVLSGHGVGYTQHEDPDVLNYGIPHQGLKLKEGLIIAIEPMVTENTSEVIEMPDGSFVTKTGCLAAHFEHTIAITNYGSKILTQ